MTIDVLIMFEIIIPVIMKLSEFIPKIRITTIITLKNSKKIVP